jgi:hypothetical protein
MTEWARANGCDASPMTELDLPVPCELPVDRLAWLVGPIPRRLDATGIVLDFAHSLDAAGR